MTYAKHFRWLPNALTLVRIALAPVICWAAANNRWTLGFWLLVLAQLTDFLDGLAAKKLAAITPLGRQLDRYADGALSAGSIIGLALAGLVSWWIVVVAPVISAFLAYERLFPFKQGVVHRVRPMISVVYMISVWVALAWTFTAQAYGWRWWYIPLTLCLLGFSALLKRHRLRAWLGIDPRH